MLESLDADAVRRWCAAGLAGLRRHQAEIDELNVYPVPDGDTGTNLVLTLSSAAQELEREHGGGLAASLYGMAQGALLGARGNSGVIVATLLRGIADSLSSATDRPAGTGDPPHDPAPPPAPRGRALARALSVAAKAGYAAVAQPVEGTVLTVAAAAAIAAEQADSDDLASVARAAALGAREALARTPEQLAVLALAGVVDAGGRGLVVLLDALVEAITGEVPRAAPATTRPATGALLAAHEIGSGEFGYEVQYLLEAPEPRVEALRLALAELGDSVAVVGSGGTWNVHVHVNDVGAAIEAGIEAGRPYRISVTRFADEPAGAAAAAGAFDGDARGIVVVCASPGLAPVFRAEGAVIVTGGPTSNPSTAEVLAGIRATRAGRVVVLPNDANVHAAAAAAAEQARAAGIGAAVVPTRSHVQALAALAVRDPQRHFDDEVIVMAEAAGACRYAEVTYATREALTVAGRCVAGDVLALIEGEVNLIGSRLLDTCVTLLDRMLAAGGELVTLIAGAQAPPELVATLSRHISEHWPFVEVQCYDGGQAHYPLLVGVE